MSLCRILWKGCFSGVLNELEKSPVNEKGGVERSGREILCRSSFFVFSLLISGFLQKRAREASDELCLESDVSLTTR